jgi:hypothetical protein
MNIGENRRLDAVCTDIAQLFLDTFGIVYAFDPQLIVYPEDDCTAVGIGQGDDFGDELLDIAETNLELEVRILAAAE